MEETEDIDLNACPWTFIPAYRSPMPFDNSDSAYRRSHDPNSPGSTQRRPPNLTEILTDILTDDLYEFESLKVYQAVKSMHTRNRGMQLAQITLHAYRCAATISKEILELDKAPGTYMGLATTLSNQTLPDNWEDFDEQQRTDLRNIASPTVTHPAMGIPTSDRNDLLFVGGLSSGTQGIFSWIFYLALKLALFRNFEKWLGKVFCNSAH